MQSVDFLKGGAWGGVRVERDARDDTRSAVKSLLQFKTDSKNKKQVVFYG